MQTPLRKNRLHEYAINWRIAKQEFNTFKRWFGNHPTRQEKSIQNSLYRLPRLIQLIGYYFGIKGPTKVGVEVDIIGQFKSDLTIVDAKRKSYCIIELESADKKSIFTGKRRKRNWSNRFEGGFSQCIDWASEFAANSKNERRYAELDNVTSRTFALIVGKRCLLSYDEKNRFDYRKSLIDTFKFLGRCNFEIIAYDELIESLENDLKDLGV